MFSSVLLLSTDDGHRACWHLRQCNRIRCTQFILGATFAALVASVPAVLGQSDTQPGGVTQATPKAEICDESQSGPQQHSLTTSRTLSPKSDEGPAEEQPSPQGSSELRTRDVRLPELESSNSGTQQQDLQCTKTNSGAQPGETAEPASETKPAVAQEDSQNAPVVSYVDGNLTLNAQNARLGDIIEAIRVRTGISVEFPPEGMGDRVFDHVGPVPLRDALMELLYGSGFNYIIKTSSQDPQTVTKLILSAQAHRASAGAAQQANQPLTEQADVPTAYGAAGFRNEAPAEAIQPIPVATVPSSNIVPGVPPGFNVQQAATAAQKTPGQILDELQKRQLQMLDDQSPQP